MTKYLFSGFAESDLTDAVSIDPGSKIKVPGTGPTRSFQVDPGGRYRQETCVG